MMVRLAVAALCVCALAYGSDFDEAVVPESYDAEPVFEEEALVQKLPQRPEDKVSTRSKDVEVHEVVEKKFVPVPKEAGDENAYRNEAKNQHSQETTSNSQSIKNAERSAGLQAASVVMRKRQAVNRQEAEKHQVAYLMNVAAQLAAVYKKKVQLDSNALLAVKKAKLVVKAQEEIVLNFRKQLAASQRVLRQKQNRLTKRRMEEQNAKFRMEKSGNDYTTAKQNAIKADNAEKQREQEKRDTKAFEKVAESAVAKAAAKAAARKARVTIQKKKNTKPQCNDCTKLPTQYKQGLPKGKTGSCADCPTWATSGYCTSSQYKAFMADYCKGSCQKKLGGACRL